MRLPDQADGDLPEYDPQAFDYWRTASGTWYLNVPGVGLANLAKHQVCEHPDQTISVTPSIRVWRSATIERHGYFERGHWRDV